MMAYNFPNGLGMFYKDIYKLVDDPSSDPLISWSKSNNNSFVIWNVEELIRRNMLSKFTCNKLSEFHAELNYHGFRRIKKGSGEIEFGNEDFVRGHPERLRNMMLKTWRKKRAKSRAKEAAKQSADRFQRLQI